MKKYRYVSKIVHENSIGAPRNAFGGGGGGFANMIRFIRYTCIISGDDPRPYSYVPANSVHVVVSYDIPVRKMGAKVLWMCNVELWANGEVLKKKGLSRENINSYLHGTTLNGEDTRNLFAGDATLALPEPDSEVKLMVYLSVRVMLRTGESCMADSIFPPPKFCIPIEIEEVPHATSF